MKIGVFDSGVGGLTVLRALLPRIANAEYLYLGDTARLPYGSKSQATIARYAVSSSQFLIDQGCEFLVIACNTASALALEEIRQTAEPHGIPVVGVIGPGAAAAAAATVTRDALVIATSATVQSHAYAIACQSLGLRSLEKACPLLVPLVEEGWIDHPITAEVVRHLPLRTSPASRRSLPPSRHDRSRLHPLSVAPRSHRSSRRQTLAQPTPANHRLRRSHGQRSRAATRRNFLGRV